MIHFGNLKELGALFGLGVLEKQRTPKYYQVGDSPPIPEETFLQVVVPLPGKEGAPGCPYTLISLLASRESLLPQLAGIKVGDQNSLW